MPSCTSANKADTDSGLKRTLASSDALHDHNLQPPTKKPKRETKLDKLKTDQKSGAVELKKITERILKLVQGRAVASENLLKAYIDIYDDIFAGRELGEDALELFELPFANYFQPKEVSLMKLDPGMVLL